MSSVDISALKELAKDIEEFKRQFLYRLTETGAEYMREEVPKDTHRLERGIGTDIDYDSLRAEVYASAESDRRGARKATLHLQDGKTKDVKLRPTKAYNYAEVIALGNKDAVLTPRKAKAFLIPVSSAPSNGDYITDGDEIFVVRKTKKGMKGNPFHERAAKRLENDAENISSGLAQEFFE